MKGNVMKDKVIIFACIEKNIGDDLFVYALTKRYPDTEFIIESNADYGDLSSISNLSFSKKLSLWQLLSTAQPKSVVKSIAVQIGRSIMTMSMGKHKVAVYIVGNAFKNLSYTGEKQSNWIRNRRKLSEQFYLLSTNFGPYNDERWVNDHKPIFSSMTDVCFREKASYNLFSELSNIRYAPDAVLSLGLQKNVCGQDKTVLVSIIDCNDKNRNHKMRQYSDAYEKKIADIINEYNKRGHKVVIINSNTEQDRAASERIFSQLNDTNKVSVFNYDGDFLNVLKLFSEAFAIIGTRLHTIVLGWLFQIKVCPVIYDIKVKNILDDYGFTGLKISLENIDEYYTDTIINSLERYSFSLDKEIVIEAEKQFALLDKLLL